jgi:hypothetical protein
MQIVDEKPETIHLYVVREEEPKPSLLPIFLSAVALSILLVYCVLTPYQQPVTRLTIRVPAVLLPLKTFTATAAIIPTGVKVFPATTAHGVLTITNGSVIAQTIPQGFRLGNVVTDSSVFVPAGSADGFGYAAVTAHVLFSGKIGNIPAYAVNQVEGSSVFIRNLAAFQGGRDAYSVKFITSNDRNQAFSKIRDMLISKITGLHYPCRELWSLNFMTINITWRCQFVTYSVPSYMHVSNVQLTGTHFLLSVWFVAYPKHIWVK